MTLLLRPTLRDCRTLETSLDPKVRALRAAHGKLRASWEQADIFGAERFARDLGGLEARWADARRMLSRVRVGRRATLTPAQPAYDRLVRAVRQGGVTAPMQRGDLAELARRLRKQGLRTPGFGFEWSEVWNSNPVVSAYHDFQAWTGAAKNLKDCSDLIKTFDVAIPDLQRAFRVLEPAWQSVNPSEAAAFARDAASMQAAWDGAKAKAKPMLDEYGPSDTTAAQNEWDALNAAAGLVVPLSARLAQARAAIAARGAPLPDLQFRPLPPPSAQSRDAFLHATDPNSPGVLGRLADLGGRLADDKSQEKKGDAPWYADPLANGWVQAGLVVGAVGVVGYTLGQVRAFLPAR